MDLGLAGRRALVLGASSGLGRAIAGSLAAEGARVACGGRDAERLASVVASLPGAVAVRGDLTDADASHAVVDDAVRLLGGLDICVVNTGGGRAGPLTATTAEDDDAAYEAMLRPALRVARRVAPALAASGAGALAFVTARSVLEASPDLALSSVFRSGVSAAARSLALELAPAVRVNVVVPGQFDTPALARFEAFAGVDRARTEASIPMRRVGRATELGDVVAFVCSERASYLTGAVIRVDGGSVRGF